MKTNWEWVQDAETITTTGNETYTLELTWEPMHGSEFVIRNGQVLERGEDYALQANLETGYSVIFKRSHRVFKGDRIVVRYMTEVIG